MLTILISLQCQSRSRECIYTPSRRGGPRCRKKARAALDAAEEEVKHIPDNVYAMLSQEPADTPLDREFASFQLNKF